jgi:hypothetical protein
VAYYSDNPITATKEILAEAIRTDNDDLAGLRHSRRLGADRIPDNQHVRLGGEARLDTGCRSEWLPGWMLLLYGGQPRWEREATYTELHRWCRFKLDRQTNSVAEAISRKASRSEKAGPLNANVGRRGARQGESGFVTAADQSSFQAWQREQHGTPESRWLPAQWAAFLASLTDLERRTLDLLADELHARGTDRGIGRAVARMLNCDEKTVRDRRSAAVQELWRAGIAYVIRGKVDHGPLWASRRQAPSGTPIRSALADKQLEVRNAPISMGEVIPLPAFLLEMPNKNSLRGR